jgi:hypothetical protein
MYATAAPEISEIILTPAGDESADVENATAASAQDLTIPALVELLLKDRRRLYRILRVHAAPATILPRLLAIALAGFLLFGVAMSLVLTVASRWPSLSSLTTWVDGPFSMPLEFEPIASAHGKLAPWLSGEALVLAGSYAFGLVAASGVCLPSLYFYCLLAGVKMSMVDVVVHAVKSKAIAAVALVGILPIYVAIAMGVVIFGGNELYLIATMLLGLALPFIAGVWGTVSLYQGFAQMCNTMPPGRAARRECFLRRLVLSWSVCYSAVMPVMIYSLWEVFSRA